MNWFLYDKDHRHEGVKSYTKYRNYPSISAIKEKTKSASGFTFNHKTKEVVMKEVKDVDVSKVSQENDIPT